MADPLKSDHGGYGWPDDRSMVALSRKVLVDHYERRDIDGVMRVMAEDLTWVGPLENQHAHRAVDMRAIIEPEYGIRVRMVDDEWVVRSLPSARVVVGRYGLVVDGTEVEELVFRQAATFVWIPAPAGPRVVHLHLSSAYDVPPRVDEPFSPGEDGIAYVIDAVTPPVTGKRSRIRFETDEGDVRFVAEDRIVRAEAQGRGSSVVFDEGAFHTHERLTQLEERLPEWFVRTHRSCLANARRIVSLRRFAAVMDDGSECPIAERRYLEVGEAVDRAAARSVPRA